MLNCSRHDSTSHRNIHCINCLIINESHSSGSIMDHLDNGIPFELSFRIFLFDPSSMENCPIDSMHSRSPSLNISNIPGQIDSSLPMGPPLDSSSPLSNKLNRPTKQQITPTSLIRLITNLIRSLLIKYSINTHQLTLQLKIQINHHQTNLHMALHLFHLLCSHNSLINER